MRVIHSPACLRLVFLLYTVTVPYLSQECTYHDCKKWLFYINFFFFWRMQGLLVFQSKTECHLFFYSHFVHYIKETHWLNRQCLTSIVCGLSSMMAFFKFPDLVCSHANGVVIFLELVCHPSHNTSLLSFLVLLLAWLPLCVCPLLSPFPISPLYLLLPVIPLSQNRAQLVSQPAIRRPHHRDSTSKQPQRRRMPLAHPYLVIWDGDPSNHQPRLGL